MIKFISLEATFDIYEATFSVTATSDSVHNEVYNISPNDYDIDELMKQCESVSTFMITAKDGGGHVYSGYRLSEIYTNEEKEDELILIFVKDDKTS